MPPDTFLTSTTQQRLLFPVIPKYTDHRPLSLSFWFKLSKRTCVSKNSRDTFEMLAHPDHPDCHEASVLEFIDPAQKSTLGGLRVFAAHNSSTLQASGGYMKLDASGKRIDQSDPNKEQFFDPVLDAMEGVELGQLDHNWHHIRFEMIGVCSIPSPQSGTINSFTIFYDGKAVRSADLGYFPFNVCGRQPLINGNCKDGKCRSAFNMEVSDFEVSTAPHPCDDGTNSCDKNVGVCSKADDGGAGYTCSCPTTTHQCKRGCTAPFQGNQCAVLATPNPSHLPVITILGDTVLTLAVNHTAGAEYEDEGAKCSDEVDGQINAEVITTGDIISLNKPNIGIVQYECTASDGMSATARRTIYVDGEHGVHSASAGVHTDAWGNEEPIGRTPRHCMVDSDCAKGHPCKANLCDTTPTWDDKLAELTSNGVEEEKPGLFSFFRHHG